MKASDLVTGKRVSMLLKGPTKFGKTIAACSVAVEGPIYMFYWDKNEPIELRKFYKQYRPELLERITFDVYNAKNANECINKLISFQKDCRYVAIVNDSVTNMTSAAVNWSMGFRDSAKKELQLIPGWDEYKVETAMVTQALDLCKALPVHMIWTAHPVSRIKIEGSGSSQRVTKVNPIVSVGSKVADIIPGNFNEVYHFGLDNDYSSGKLVQKRIVHTVGVGDDFAGTVLDIPAEFDITNKLFWEEFKRLTQAA